MIDLTKCNDKCFAEHTEGCTLLTEYYRCDYTCDFYKPIGCKDWIRIGNEIYPPEEYEEVFGTVDNRPPVWVIRTVKE